jgi:alkylated DNA repair dioxygenase AlkB
MSTPLQGSLLDGFGEIEIGSIDGIHRTKLDHGAWVDMLPGWLSGADMLFERLVKGVPWQAERRPMYDRVVDVPRLLRFYDESQALPDPVLDDARDALSSHYQSELGEPFRTAGLCYYRDGRDSVAWHGDRIGRKRLETVVAVLSLGAPRRFLMRPKGGGPSVRFVPGAGDLLVMGGTTQRTWEHTVPKCAYAGPRVSVQFREGY